MRECEKLVHMRSYCRYHIVICTKIPEHKTIYPMLRKEITSIMQELCSQWR